MGSLIMDGVVYRVKPVEDYGEKLDSKEIQKTQVFNVGEMRTPGEQEIKESTEMNDIMVNLMDDSIDPQSRMSGIDMRTNLGYNEISNILSVDTLVSYRFLPVLCLALTRQSKRLKVSLKRGGRDDMVQVSVGKQERDAQKGGMGLMQRLQSGFGKGD